jgi:hypothetical protein
MLTCPRCACTELSSYASLVAHVVLCHGSEPNFAMSCTLQHASGTCCSVFSTCASYKSHMYKFHSTLLTSGISSTGIQYPDINVISCPVCNEYHNSLRELGSHYRTHCQQGISVPCIAKHCNCVFEVFSSYTSHMVRKHRNICLEQVKEEYKHIREANVCREVEIFSSSCTDSNVSDSLNVPLMIQNTALMFLKMRSQYGIPDSTLQLVIDDFSNFLTMSDTYVKQQLANLGARYEWPPEVLKELHSIVGNQSWKAAMKELSTDWKRNAYYRDNLPYVAPVQYHYEDKCDSKDSFQYIPLLDILAVVLKDSSIREQILNPPPGVDGQLMSFRDGNLYKNHPVFSSKKLVIEILIYSDEFEVVNPLGPHKKKHKMMAFYLSIGNLLSCCKSQKSSIFLLALAKSLHIQKYGMRRIAEVINTDLLLMENEGITVVGYPDRIFGALAFIAGDNLNSHLIGGFNASFSPNVLRPCRYCLISNEELQKCDFSDDLPMRTKSNYDEQTSEIAADSSKCTHYGIRFRSVFISGSYHVVDGLPPDIMHDLLEGVVPFEMALVLRNLIENNCFSLEQLNCIISKWNYGQLDKANKPVPLSDPLGDTIKQNAGRMWSLLRLLPLMVGPMVEQASSCYKFWCFFLELKTIVELVFAPRLAIGHVQHLKSMIQDHIANFMELFPNKKLKPKHHFLLHYAHAFLTYGPLRSCWCMRFEAKHSYFTRLMTIVNNYKNACSTLAERHQMKLAYDLATGNSFLLHEISFSSTINEDMDYLADGVIQALESSGISRSEQLHRCTKFVKVNGISYYCKMYIVIGFCNDTPVLGRIDSIYLQQMKCYFLTRICNTQFNEHLGAYGITATDEIHVCRVDSLLDYYPLTGYVVGNQRFVVLKNFVYEHSLYTY